MAILLEPADEKSTYGVSIAVEDMANRVVVPNAISWKLTDSSGNTVRTASLTPGLSMLIVLSGSDLAITDESQNMRYLTVTSTYDSTEGSGLPLNQEYKFPINKLRGVA